MVHPLHGQIQKLVRRIYRRINGLKIQGATRIAIEGVKTIREVLEHDPEDFEKYARWLESARPTEPELRNSLELVRRGIADGRNGLEICDKVLLHIRESRGSISLNGQKIIRDGAVVLTHCHSSEVVGLLKKAWTDGTRFKVYSTETRPMFQGRTTAEELSHFGIPTTMIVDSAANFFMPEVDVVLVGCDAINWKGDLFNKIGTSMIALSAKANGVPLYSATSLLKFDPLTRKRAEPIERRAPDEVFHPHYFRRFTIRNPAFDRTGADLIKGYVTEFGIVKPREIEKRARKLFSSL